VIIGTLISVDLELLFNLLFP